MYTDNFLVASVSVENRIVVGGVRTFLIASNIRKCFVLCTVYCVQSITCTFSNYTEDELSSRHTGKAEKQNSFSLLFHFECV